MLFVVWFFIEDIEPNKKRCVYALNLVDKQIENRGWLIEKQLAMFWVIGTKISNYVDN